MEATLVQSRRATVKMMNDMALYDGEILEFKDPFNSKDIMEMVYEAFLGLMVPHIVATSQKDADSIFRSILGGWYMPCEPRAIFSGQVHQKVDGLPSYAGVFMDKGFYIGARARNSVPGFIAPCPGKMYEVVAFRREGDGTMRSVRHCVVVTANDRVLPCLRRGRDAMEHATGSQFYNAMAINAAVAINTVTDSKYLWNVRTVEATFLNLPTPLTLGVSEGKIKSLFYARSLPVTESGRKRPILHWVRAHERRIAAGIDVDVSKHLRGIDRFEMEGFDFEITQPRKAASQA